MDRLGHWFSHNFNARQTGLFVLGSAIAVHESFGEGRLEVYGFCLMLLSPAFAAIAEAMLTGSRNGRNGSGRNGNGGGRGID